MKTIVIYKSKTGFTQKYAQWIAAELSADLLEATMVNVDQLTAYETVIYGGGLYAAGINGVKLITKNLDKLQGKKIVIFATGASPSCAKTIHDVKSKNFTPDEQQSIRFFYLRGGFDYSKLKIFEKVLMNLLKWELKRKKQLTSDEKGMLAAYDQPVDFTRKRNIDEIIAYVNH